MTIRSTRRTVLATGATALLLGCGDSGEGNDSGSTSVEPGEPGEELARTSDIPVGGGEIFKDEEVVVTQPDEGHFKAFSAICTHQRCIVADVSDGTINCACHGSKFRITDGAVVHGPATRSLPKEEITITGNSIHLA
ncbi:Rieske (2Fe-2S) protein [Streptomyces sporangiiformans]|uniref:Cytochrome bc1 complex Rieske iron-sulfur subunit n=1 Tax=Streptomyces sporangiiformans TaxID=2315329 RepID=A0A505DHR5_9ACTN|nr:Rieske (2Fe-2S) protein [Streptomyces sporangiiformans]TPQ22807.1 Rieske (2Fe-2S) protein [Streptomyces sporangiiformans]